MVKYSLGDIGRLFVKLLSEAKAIKVVAVWRSEFGNLAFASLGA